MDIAMWMLAGAALGWIGYTYLRFNAARGMMISVVIGAVGGIVGGNMVAPMFTAAQAVPGAFSSSALIFAAGVAATFLAVGNLVYNRWGV
jgi:uncharacterized membrane protein YeaQ/YmgE (transglycosylase-associated protein family)